MKQQTNLGLKIMLARKKALLTQSQVADELNKTRQAFAAWESGIVTPSIKNLQKLSKVLKVPFEYFLNDLDDNLVEINFFIKKSLYQEVLSKSKKEQKSVSDFILQIVEEYLK